MELEYDNYERIMVSAILRETPESSVLGACGLNFVDAQGGMKPNINVLSIIKVAEPWPEVVRQAERMANNPQFSFQRECGELELIIDNTNGTSQILEMTYDMEIDASCIELSLSETDINKWRFRDVAGALIACFQGGRIQIASGIALAKTLEAALAVVSVRDSATIDALPLAVALIAFAAEKAVPADTYDRGSGYDTANWGL